MKRGSIDGAARRLALLKARGRPPRCCWVRVPDKQPPPSGRQALDDLSGQTHSRRQAVDGLLSDCAVVPLRCVESGSGRDGRSAAGPVESVRDSSHRERSFGPATDARSGRRTRESGAARAVSRSGRRPRFPRRSGRPQSASRAMMSRVSQASLMRSSSSPGREILGTTGEPIHPHQHRARHRPGVPKEAGPPPGSQAQPSKDASATAGPQGSGARCPRILAHAHARRSARCQRRTSSAALRTRSRAATARPERALEIFRRDQQIRWSLVDTVAAVTR